MRGLPRRTLLVVAAAVVLPCATALAQPDSARAPAAKPDRLLAEKGVKKGYLFSAVSFADSAFGREWARLRPEAEAKFPGLKLAKPEDLHITVVYIGGDWKVEDLDRIRPHAEVAPTATGRMTPEVVRMGRNLQVVAVELHGAPAAWTDSVIAAKSALNGLGLKKPDAYDASFRTHITLAEARHSPPTAADSTELGEFQAWITPAVAAAPGRFSVAVGPRTVVRLWLAGATRPEDSPEYVTVEDFLARQLPPAAK
jgi:2'-5' RNA ligase